VLGLGSPGLAVVVIVVVVVGVTVEVEFWPSMGFTGLEPAPPPASGPKFVGGICWRRDVIFVAI
jgi:hypothetical protein